MGVVQESLFEHVETKIMIEDLKTGELHEQITNSILPFGSEVIMRHYRIVSSDHYAVYTVAELGVMLCNDFEVVEQNNNGVKVTREYWNISAFGANLAEALGNLVIEYIRIDNLRIVLINERLLL